ncbi:MAG: hypothetical protein ACLTSL_10925 [Odoribacter splanchnicus]
MKILYFLSFDIQKFHGVFLKVVNQITIWKSQGYEVELLLYWSGKVGKELREILYENEISYKCFIDHTEKAWLIRRGRWLLRSVNRTENDIIDYIREYGPTIIYARLELINSPLLLRLIKNHKVVLEVNTFLKKEFKLNSKSSFLMKLYYWISLIHGYRYVSKAKGVVAVTYELCDYIKNENINSNVFVLPNSIKLEEVRRITKNIRRKEPVLIFMASRGLLWHGIEELLLFSKQVIGKLNIWIIGYSENEFNDVSSNVTFWGILNEEKYKKVLEEADVGMGTIALYKKNMQEACPLKVRAYLSNGLPVILPYVDTAFVGQNYPDFVLQIPNKPNSLLEYKDSIVDFCYKWKDHKLVNEQVADYIDGEVLERRRLKFMFGL